MLARVRAFVLTEIAASCTSKMAFVACERTLAEMPTLQLFKAAVCAPKRALGALERTLAGMCALQL